MMNNRTILSIDRCIEVLMGYVSARVSDSFIGDKELDSSVIDLIRSTSELIKTRAKIDGKKTTNPLEIPDFMK